MAQSSMKSWIFRLPTPALVDRFLVGELLPPLMLGVGLFTALSLAIGTLFDLLRQMVNDGLGVGAALQIVFLRLPEFLVFGLPMAMLLAVLMGYSNLASQSEITALRSMGLGKYRLMVPPLILGLVIAVLAFGLDNYVVPLSNQQVALVQNRALGENAPAIAVENIIVPTYENNGETLGQAATLKNLFYAETYDGTFMTKITILDRSAAGVSQVITAERGLWQGEKQSWLLENGAQYNLDAQGSYKEIQRFEVQRFALAKTPITITTQCQRREKITVAQAQQCIDSLALSNNRKKIRSFQVQIQNKFAGAAMAIVFGLVGGVLGMRSANQGKAAGFSLSLMIVLGYYIFSFFATSLGVLGSISPMMAAWLPDFMGLGAAIALLLRTP